MDIEISFIINMLNFRCLQNQGKVTWQTMGYMSLTPREEAQTGDINYRVIRIQVIVKTLKMEYINQEECIQKKSQT